MIQNTRGLLAAFLILPAVVACAPKTASMAGMDHSAMGHDMSGGTPITIPPGAGYTKADVQFMQGMIAHHAQAIFMTSLAKSNGASPKVLFLATKIDQSQAPEIKLMQGWLWEKKQFVPDTSSYHNMMMPGMLTEKQIADLKKARGPEFDRQFLTLMIQHHEGALKMVADLFSTTGAAQDIDVSVFANDVDVTQSAEIAQMRQLLSDL